MAVTTLATPPSLADARRAAEAVAVEGVSRVLLFGSLARGEQTPESDIDLVAIFDDLDYRTRWRRKVELENLASSEVGYPVEVRVTDWPEWAVRSEVVTTSFESRIAADAVVLRDGEPQGVNWGKEIGLPATNQQEAVASLENATTALILLEGHLEPSGAERAALEEADPESYVHGLSARMRAVCSQAQLVMENSLKALIHHGVFATTPDLPILGAGRSAPHFKEGGLHIFTGVSGANGRATGATWADLDCRSQGAR